MLFSFQGCAESNQHVNGRDVLLLQQVPEHVNGESYKLMPHEGRSWRR